MLIPRMNTLSVSGKLNASKNAPAVPQYLTHPGFMMPFFYYYYFRVDCGAYVASGLFS